MSELTNTADEKTLVVMGVSGVGKTSVARALSLALPAHYIEADDFHPSANIEAMRAGTPLTDDMRYPWLRAVAAEIKATHAARPRGNVVIACSALKKSYREILRAGNENTIFIHLSAERSVISARLSSRKGHFMAATLLDSQCATLEPPSGGENFVDIDVSNPLPDVVAETIRRLQAACPPIG